MKKKFTLSKYEVTDNLLQDNVRIFVVFTTLCLRKISVHWYDEW